MSYAHPDMAEALQDTLGIIVFQEQVLKVAVAVAGFGPGQAELLRRALGRKRAEEDLRRLRQAFVEGATARGVDTEQAHRIYDQLAGFAGFGFNRAHAASFALLSYVSAWIFEKRGFAYSKGHQLMDTIHGEFQPGGKLHKALDGSTPFRQPEQWKTVRGRAWAIHDGILEVIDRKWDDLKMIKQVGRHAGANTFPDAEY